MITKMIGIILIAVVVVIIIVLLVVYYESRDEYKRYKWSIVNEMLACGEQLGYIDRVADKINKDKALIIQNAAIPRSVYTKQVLIIQKQILKYVSADLLHNIAYVVGSNRIRNCIKPALYWLSFSGEPRREERPIQYIKL